MSGWVFDVVRTDLVPPQWGVFLWIKDHSFRIYGSPEDMAIHGCLLWSPITQKQEVISRLFFNGWVGF